MRALDIIKSNSEIIPALLNALTDDWSLCDDDDKDSFMVLINEDREAHPDVKPDKILVSALENEGFISIDKNRSDAKGQKRKFMNFFDEPVPIPFVYFYKVTAKGKSLVDSSQ